MWSNSINLIYSEIYLACIVLNKKTQKTTNKTKQTKKTHPHKTKQRTLKNKASQNLKPNKQKKKNHLTGKLHVRENCVKK